MVHNHNHHAGCNCAEEMKQSDTTGDDLFPCIELEDLECFNEAVTDSIKKVIRPLNDRLAFRDNPSLSVQSDLDTELVVKIQFNSEVKVKCVKVAGGTDGTAPNKLRVYKNEESVDFDIIQDKKALHEISLAEDLTGDLDYALPLNKFNNCQNIVLGFVGNFGANTTIINFIGLKGQYLRDKSKAQQIVYEVRANIADHPKTGEERKNNAHLGF